MINIPTETLSQYSSILAKKSIPIPYQYDYKRWLRYYIDFCHKYGFSHSQKESLTQFIKKLQEKHQTPIQQEQAGQAVSFGCGYFRTTLQKICALFNIENNTSIYRGGTATNETSS